MEPEKMLKKDLIQQVRLDQEWHKAHFSIDMSEHDRLMRLEENYNKIQSELEESKLIIKKCLDAFILIAKAPSESINLTDN